MASLRVTAMELLERTRRLAGNCEPPRLARIAILSFVRFLYQKRGWQVDSGELISPDLSGDFDLCALAEEEDGIGRLWQAMNEPMLKKAFAAAGKGDCKFCSSEIPAVTQLFTPRPVVEFLLDQTLGRTWAEAHHNTAGARGNVIRATDLRLLDPSCGTMNFGLVAIDKLRAMYREELARAGEPGWPVKASVASEAEIDDAILANNLFGVELDAFVIELARHTIALKLGRPLAAGQLQIFCGDALLSPKFGAKWPTKFDVVATNPPYLSARNVAPELVRRWKKAYPLAARDAYGCFIERSLQLLKPGGRAGLLTMHSFMFLGSYEPFRHAITQRAAVEQIAHFGPGLFKVGNPGTLQTAAFVLRAEKDSDVRDAQTVRVLRLVDAESKTDRLTGAPQPPGDGVEFRLSQRELTSSPRGAWIYWLSDRERSIVCTFPKLGDIAPPRQGLATTDNARFVRNWWEIGAFSPHATCFATPGRWSPYVKAGQSRRWYESPRHRVNWESDGREIKASIVEKYPYLRGKWEWVAKNANYYGRAGVTYSYLTSGRFSARQLQAGGIFDVAGSSLFPDDPLLVLAVLNSSAGRRLLAAINPTVNFQVGDLAELPMPRTAPPSLRDHVTRLIDLLRQVDQWDETAPDFVAPPAWSSADEQCATVAAEIDRLERAADVEVAELYGLPVEPHVVVDLPLDRVDLARRWVSFAVRRTMESLEWTSLDAAFAQQVGEKLSILTGEAEAAQIDRQLGGIEAFIREAFAAWQNRLWRSRPRWWVFGDRQTQVMVAHDRADRKTLSAALRVCGQSLPAKWDRYVDDGIAVNLSPLSHLVADRSLRRALSDCVESAEKGELAWSRTYAGRKAQSRIELRMRSTSDKLVARAALALSSEQVNSAPTRFVPADARQ